MYFILFIQEIENMYHVSIELHKHEWKFGRTRNAVGTKPQVTVSKAFLSSPKLSRVFL